MSRINGSRGASEGNVGHDFSYGTFKCTVCGKKFELGKWSKRTICISCEVKQDLAEDKYKCDKWHCWWHGCINDMKYVPPTEEDDNSYYLCPKCGNVVTRHWCGEVDHWDHA